MEEPGQLKRAFIDATAGSISGGISRTVTSPLDVIKIRFQVQLEPTSSFAFLSKNVYGTSKYTGMFQASKDIFREEGLSGFWRGNVPALLMVMPYTAIQFMVLHKVKTFASGSSKSEDHIHLSPYLSFMSGALAGCAATVGSYPFDLIRTILASQGEPKIYPNMRSAFVEIMKTRGFRGLYAGLSPTLVEIIPYAGLQFGTYDSLKRWTMAYNARWSSDATHPEETLSSFQLFLCGLAAGSCAKAVCHPLDVVKKRFQTPCGHNFCLKCFEKWVGQGKRTCAICRTSIPPKMASQPRINSSLVIAIRMAKMTRSNVASGPPKAYYSILNQNRPDKAYTTERAKKSGKANACSGKIFVTVAPDHFGPILAENDPERGMGVLVGETWEDRMECRQWGAHLPHVAGICGQSDYGAQSVALSGGYEDDEDHGEWFLYTGSGGRDLSGNKRTNKTQSFDQKFDKSNEALRVSCKKGYPVRVVRSHKEKRSAYAPEKGVRYDGIYRIEKCWRKPGIQGYKVCRYLFVRCDNDPAPWTSDENGDRPRPLPTIKELKDATDVTDRKSSPSWDYDEEKACWLWKIPPPGSRKHTDSRDGEVGTTTKKVRRNTHMMSVSERLLKEFCCLICHKVMNLPLTTPCAHNFCKSCLQDTFAGQTFIKERNCEGRRALRAQKNIMKCPSCSNDISEYLQNPQVNRELMSVIESLQRQTKEMQENAVSEEEMEETAALGEEVSKTDENIGDVIKEVKDKEAEAVVEVKDLSSETDGKVEKPKAEVEDEVMEAVAVGEVVPDETVNKSETIAKASPKGKSLKNKKRKAGATDNTPNKKLHEDTAILINEDANPNDNDMKAVASLKTEASESKDKKVGEVGKEGKKTSKQKKDGDAKCSSPTSAGARTRSKKA